MAISICVQRISEVSLYYWNPDNVNVPAKIVLDNNNRDVTFQVTDNKTIECTLERSTGKFYWEVEYVTAGGSRNFIGIGNASFTPTDNPGHSADDNSWSYYTDSGRRFHGGWTLWGVDGGVKAVGTVYMFAVDLDTGDFWTGANGSWFNLNGYDIVRDPVSLCPSMYTDAGISGVAMLPMVGGQDIGTELRSRFNGSELSYDPPEDFSSWDVTVIGPPNPLPLITWNPDNVNVPAKIVLDNNDRDATFQVTDNKTIECTLLRNTGKFYWEVEYVTAGGSKNFLGIGQPLFNPTGNPGHIADNRSWSYYTDLGRRFHSGAWSLFGPSGGVKAVGTIYMFAVDLDAGEFWVGANGQWFNVSDYDSSDPAGTCVYMYKETPGISSLDMIPMVGGQDIGTELRCSFEGNQLNYTPPSGFTAWAGIR